MPQHPKCNGAAREAEPACLASTSQQLQTTQTPRLQAKHQQRKQNAQRSQKAQGPGRRQQKRDQEPPKVQHLSTSARSTDAAMQVYNHKVPNQLPSPTMHQPFQPPLAPFHHIQRFAPVNTAGWLQKVVEAQQHHQHRPNCFNHQQFSKMLQQRHHQQQMQTQQLLVRNSACRSGSGISSKTGASLSQVSPQNTLCIGDLRKSDVGFLWYVTDIYGNKRKLNAEDVIEFCPSCKTGPPIHWSNIRNKRVAQVAHELRCNRQSKGNCDYNSSRERAVKRKKRAAQRVTDSARGAKSGSQALDVTKPSPEATTDSSSTNSKGASSTGAVPAQATLTSQPTHQSSSKRGASVISQSICSEGERIKRGRGALTVSSPSAEGGSGMVNFGGVHVTRPCSACGQMSSAAFNFCPHCGVNQRQAPGQESFHVPTNSSSAATVQGQFLGNF